MAISTSRRQAAKNISFTSTQVLYILLLASSFLLGYLFAKVQTLEQKGAQTTPTQTTGQQAAQPPQPQRPQGKANVALGHLPVMGNTNAKVTIVEFSDFQCPFCRRFWKDTLGQIEKDYIDTGKVKLAYRHLPLDFHPESMHSALASECANEQGKFWEFHDKIFEEQEKQGQGTIQYTKDDIKRWAADLGLNATQFNQCLDSEKYKNQIEKDRTDAQAAGASGTPTFFVNGTITVGALPYASFKTLIDQELNKK